MNVSEQIIEVLNYLGEKFGIVIDWSAKEVLPVLQTLCGKYIRWEIASSIMWLVVGLIALFIAYVLCNCLDVIDSSEDEYLFIACLCVIVLFGIAGICVVLVQLSDIVKCCCFPELQVFEYIQALIKSSNIQ